MAARAENRGAYLQSRPVTKHRRARKKESVFTQAAVWMIVAALLLGAGLLCWMGIQFLWDSMQNALDDLAPDGPALGLAPAGTTSGDSEAPVLSGIHDFTVYEGDTIAYLGGITASDETDPDPKITVDSTGVDLSRPGEYQVTYTASDAAGNEASATAVVTVLDKQPGYADLETIYTLADDLLSIILEDASDTREQVAAIYSWARRDIRYAGHSDRTDWRQTAYQVIQQGEGDCYGYFAVTKLMFERLGIANMDVRKVKNHDEDSDHFWSLVSLDGGESWYHFDATPRQGEGDDFCLVTDAFLDSYSESHKGSHNRDKSLYPKTP